MSPSDQQQQQWWIYRDGAIVGPVSTELVVRGLIAERIPHDARVRRDGDEAWVPILSVDDFDDATQKTTMMLDPEVSSGSMRRLQIAHYQAPTADLEVEGRKWHAPEWMLLEGETMSGPFTLFEIERKLRARPRSGAQVCRLHTFDWVSVDEAFAAAGKPPSLPPSIPPAVGVGDPMWMVFRDDGEEQGPTSLEQLAKAHAAGRLADDDLIVRFGSTERTPLIELLREHNLARPKPIDRTVVVARKLGADPVRAPERQLLVPILLTVCAALLVVVFLLAR